MGGISHPSYPAEHWSGRVVEYNRGPGPHARIGDEVALAADHTSGRTLGTVTAIYLESVELSTGDQVPVTDLVLLRRAEQ